MRLSSPFGLTLREMPAGIEASSHQLLLRAGFIRQLGQGLFSYLPLAHRSITRIENILREEMNRIGGQEITMPVVHPAEIWRRSGERPVGDLVLLARAGIADAPWASLRRAYHVAVRRALGRGRRPK